MSDKEQFARDRMREDDESLALEYSEREYLNRSRNSIPERFPADDEQPETKPANVPQKPKSC
ncbi:MAG TPA: hypothetical protein PLZ24_16625 [Flavobacteriales bacterium]|nr:hypothetical protein [Flavobacteriales bacterium]